MVLMEGFSPRHVPSTCLPVNVAKELRPRSAEPWHMQPSVQALACLRKTSLHLCAISVCYRLSRVLPFVCLDMYMAVSCNCARSRW